MPVTLGLVAAEGNGYSYGSSNYAQYGMTEDIVAWIQKNALGLGLLVAGIVVAAAGPIVGGKPGKIISLGGVGVLVGGMYLLFVNLAKAQPDDGTTTANVTGVEVR